MMDEGIPSCGLRSGPTEMSVGDDSPPSILTPTSLGSSGLASPAPNSAPSLLPVGSAPSAGVGSSFLVVPNGLHPASAAAAQLLSIDQISLNSQSSSAYNSCPYTPLNSAADEELEEDVDGENAKNYYNSMSTGVTGSAGGCGSGGMGGIGGEEEVTSSAPASASASAATSGPPSRSSSRRPVGGGTVSGPPSSIPTPPNYPARPASAASSATDAVAVVMAATRRATLAPRNNSGGQHQVHHQQHQHQQLDILPSFNSRDMLERIEFKRLKMKAARGWDHAAASGETSPNVYPFTPKNSFVDSNFEEAYRKRDMTGLENLEPDLIAKKVEEKKRVYRLDLDEAQGALDGIAEGEDIVDDPGHPSCAQDPDTTFHIELDMAVHQGGQALSMAGTESSADSLI